MCSYDILDSLIVSKYSVLLLGDSHVLHFLRVFYYKNHRVILYHSYMDYRNLYNKRFDDVLFILKYKFDL